MKNKYLLIILLAIGFLSSCGEDKKLTDFIPADATFVVRINNMELIKKANIEKYDQAELGHLIKSFFNEIPNASSAENTINDPSSLGINFKEDAYIFATPSIEAISFILNDADKLMKTFLNAGLVTDDNIAKSKDIYSFFHNNETLISWDKKRLLILRNTSHEEVELITIAKNLYSQKSKNSISENENFKKFLEKKADVSVFGTNEFLSPFLKNNSLGLIVQDVLTGTMPMTYLNFNNGSISAETKVIFTDKNKEEIAKEILGNISGYNSGKHLSYFDNKYDLFAMANVKGENLKKFLTRDDLSKQIGSIPIININDIISNLDGDITIGSMPNTDSTSEKPAFSILIDLKDPASIRSMFAQFSHPTFRILQQTGEDSYKFFNDSYFVGIKESMLYLSTDNSFSQRTPQTNKIIEDAIANKLKENKILFYGKPSSIESLSQLGETKQSEQNLFFSAFSLCESFTVTATENVDITMEVNFADKSQNSLAIILQNIDKISGNFEKNTINE